MPRGFLVKRNKNFAAVSYRSRCPDYDCEPWAGLAADPGRRPAVHAMHCFGVNPDSPDSGYGSSPATPVAVEQTFTASAYRNAIPSTTNVWTPVSCHTLSAFSPSQQSYPTSNIRQNDQHFKPILRIPTTPVRKSTPTKCSTTRKRPHPSADRSEDSATKLYCDTAKKPKAARKINFDRDDKSPVLDTFIRAAGGDPEKDGERKASGSTTPDCDQPRGLFVCKLCQGDYRDPLSLAQHQCSRIVNVVYRCLECDKVFNCHANLASHRRWHKPRPAFHLPTDSPSLLPSSSLESKAMSDSGTGSACSSSRSTPSPTGDTTARSSPHKCEHCGKTYKRPANLRRHLRRHGESDTHPCYSCGQTFNSLTERAKHALLQACHDNVDSS